MFNLRRMNLKPYSQQKKAEIVSEFVTAVTSLLQPIEMYLFGSVVGPKFDEASDIDALLVFPDAVSADEARRSWHRQRPPLPYPVDLLTIDLDSFLAKSDIGGVCFVAKHQGQMVWPPPVPATS